MPTRALIADDEPLLRQLLRLRLSQTWPELEIVAEAENGAEALARFEQFEPDLVFLDIKMPVLGGIEAARMVGDRALVVFVTAYDEFAVEAFRRGAIDYILKPVDAERLAETVARLKQRLAAPRVPRQALDEVLSLLGAHLGGPGPRGRGLSWIRASAQGQLHLVPVAEVVYFRAEDKYTKVRTLQQELLIKKPIKELGDELDPDQFWQVHRAAIVNLAFIERVDRDHRELPVIHLRGLDEELGVSRPFAHLFKQM
jgi:DNA-binding LytR/AlgR family response regulator